MRLGLSDFAVDIRPKVTLNKQLTEARTGHCCFRKEAADTDLLPSHLENLFTFGRCRFRPPRQLPRSVLTWGACSAHGACTIGLTRSIRWSLQLPFSLSIMVP